MLKAPSLKHLVNSVVNVMLDLCRITVLAFHTDGYSQLLSEKISLLSADVYIIIIITHVDAPDIDCLNKHQISSLVN